MVRLVTDGLGYQMVRLASDTNGIVSVLYWYHIGIVSVFYQYCFGIISVLYQYQYHIGIISVLYRYHIGIVLVSYRYCIGMGLVSAQVQIFGYQISQACLRVTCLNIFF